MVTKEQFLEYLRSDKYSEELSPSEKKEVFLSSLQGSSDINPLLIENLLSEYSADSPFPLWIDGFQAQGCIEIYKSGSKLSAIKKLVELGREQVGKVGIRWADDYLRKW